MAHALQGPANISEWLRYIGVQMVHTMTTAARHLVDL